MPVQRTNGLYGALIVLPRPPKRYHPQPHFLPQNPFGHEVMITEWTHNYGAVGSHLRMAAMYKGLHRLKQVSIVDHDQ